MKAENYLILCKGHLSFVCHGGVPGIPVAIGDDRVVSVGGKTVPLMTDSTAFQQDVANTLWYSWRSHVRCPHLATIQNNTSAAIVAKSKEFGWSNGCHDSKLLKADLRLGG